MQINTYYSQEALEILLSQLSSFYEPSKVNKKKLKLFFETMPFFFFDPHSQNTLYVITKEKPCSSFLDSQEDMKQYCFYLYQEFSKRMNVPCKSFADFFHDFDLRCFHESEKYKQIKRNFIHTILFVILLLIFGISFYFFQKKNNEYIS
jgi:hypothetical protein